MKKTLLFGFLLASVAVQAQTPTFSADIATLIYDNCATCHHTGSIGPFNLITYSDVVFNIASVQEHINDGHMPPWNPDSDYQSYAHDRALTDTEKALINDWINGGMPIGDTANIPTPPVFSEGSFLGTPDLKLTIPTYVSKATPNNDDYVCIALPTGLATDRVLRAIEVVPGNRGIVHHVLVFKDDFASYATDTSSGFCTGPLSGMIAGFAPGEMPMVYPNGGSVKMGSLIKANSNIVLAIHYPNGSAGQVDSTSVHLFFYDEGTTGIREVTALPLLQKTSFCIPANTVDTLTEVFPPFGTPNDYSFLSVFPHAHLLGQKFLVYAVTATNDTIPIIHIPKWDFHWQGFYLFKEILKIPQGSKLHAHISYDNTVDNIHNPNTPPQNVCAGLNTTDEMFLIYFQFLNYQLGDENIDLEELTTFTTTGSKNLTPPAITWYAYPNPFNQQITFEYALKESELVRLSIYNLQGQLVQTLTDATQAAGDYTLNWNGCNASGTSIPAGLYLAQLQIGEQTMTKKIILQH